MDDIVSKRVSNYLVRTDTIDKNKIIKEMNDHRVKDMFFDPQ